MEHASHQVLEETVRVARRGGDPEEALRVVLAVSGYRREPVEQALQSCAARIAERPGDRDAERARQLLRSALLTGVFAAN